MILLMFILFTPITFSQSNFKTGNVITNADKLRFLDSLNKYRIEAGVPILKYSFQEDSLAKFRSKTILKHIDSISDSEYNANWMEHLHYNFESDRLEYDRKNVHKDTVLRLVAECSARLNKFEKVEDLVDKLLQGWKNSKPHWEVMLDKDYEYMVLNWIVDDKREFKLQRGTIASLVFYTKGINKKSRGNLNSP